MQNSEPPIFLWTHPRSVSSAMERAMLQRGDLSTLHEPFLYLYYLGDANKALDHFDPDPQHPTDYDGIREMIFERAREQRVFVKDMCYYVANYFPADISLLREAVHTYLVRTPERSVPSYYRLDPQVTREEIGLEAVYRHFECVAECTGAPPLLIDAEDLTRDAAGTLRAYCEAVGLPFLEHSLHWDNDAVPQEWMHVAGWHRDLAKSSGLGKTGPAVAPTDTPSELQELIDYHMPFYEKLRAYRLTPTAE